MTELFFIIKSFEFIIFLSLQEKMKIFGLCRKGKTFCKRTELSTFKTLLFTYNFIVEKLC